MALASSPWKHGQDGRATFVLHYAWATPAWVSSKQFCFCFRACSGVEIRFACQNCRLVFQRLLQNLTRFTTIDHDISRFTMSIMIVSWSRKAVQISCERWLIFRKRMPQRKCDNRDFCIWLWILHRCPLPISWAILGALFAKSDKYGIIYSCFTRTGNCL